ncbi:hypothetical protein [Laspinema palackyanum]|uniref:hypothetical protein n=1 Tax=Laspinema palackyanum TaxID=3231601 RepID=UPI00345D7303|nr:hypothetical protein [Laspinema sp. D2c]
MKLDLVKQELEKLYLRSPEWIPTSHREILWQEPEPNTWVQLLEQPSEYSADQALLLCKCGDREWVAWVPEHGEVILHEDQFYGL